MNSSEIETSRPFRSVKEAAAAINQFQTLACSSPGTPASGAGSGSGQKSIPVCYEVSVVESIKRLEMELAEMRQELAFMRRRRSEMEISIASINARFHRSLSKLAEIEAAQAAERNAIREERRWEEENEFWPCFGDALSISDMDIAMERRMERKVKREKPLVPLIGRIFSKKKSLNEDIDCSYPESIYSVLS